MSVSVSTDQLLGSEVHHVRAGRDQDDLVQPRLRRCPRKHLAEQDHRPWTVHHQAREGS